MIYFTAEHLSKAYGDKQLLNDVSLVLTDTHKIGLVGLNGCGKSSLLRIIAGEDNPDRGTAHSPAKIKIAYLPQEPHFPETGTVLSYIFESDLPAMALIRDYEALLIKFETEGSLPESEQKQLLQLTNSLDIHKAWDLEHQAKTILNKLGITKYDQPLNELSGGMRKRVALARTLILPADLLLLDEPTNHMDSDSIEWLEGYLKRQKSALVMITHDRYFLERVASNILELDNGSLYMYQGSYSAYIEQKDERLIKEKEQAHKLKRLYQSELEWIRAGAQARSTKQKARIQRFEVLETQVGTKNDQNIDIDTAYTRLGKQVAELNNVCFSYGDAPLLSNINLILQKGDRLGLLGHNGVGKTTFTKLLTGILTPTSGELKIGETVHYGILEQEPEDFKSDQSLITYLRETAEYVVTRSGARLSAGQMLERFLFPPSSQSTPLYKLSGGERRRVQLLKTLMLAPNVLILDEPTNDLDLSTLTVLESYLDDFLGAAIIVSHDRYFLDRTCTRLLWLPKRGQHHLLEGAWSDNQSYIAGILAAENDASRISPALQPQQKQKNPDNKRKLSFNERRTLDQLPAEIEALEQKLDDLHKAIEAAASDYVALEKHLDEKTALEDLLLEKMALYEALSEIEA